VILVDTSVWVDHLRTGNAVLFDRLNAGRILTHPLIIGELALGDLRQRIAVLEALADLPQAVTATNLEVLHFIGHRHLSGRGIGYVDVHLLAATQLTTGAALWTHDKRLQSVAERLGLAMTPRER
jgi:predicted nucleic acid-binding protein